MEIANHDWHLIRPNKEDLRQDQLLILSRTTRYFEPGFEGDEELYTMLRMAHGAEQSKKRFCYCALKRQKKPGINPIRAALSRMLIPLSQAFCACFVRSEKINLNWDL